MRAPKACYKHQQDGSLYSNRRGNSPEGNQTGLAGSHHGIGAGDGGCIDFIAVRAIRRNCRSIGPSRTATRSLQFKSAPERRILPSQPASPRHTGTAWTVFQGTTPEPMQLKILGVLRGARGPGQDLILAQLLGAKPEYTGVVDGMSGSPVYIGNRLLGSLSYRIGSFTKDPIAGITPIEQMIEVQNMPGSEPAPVDAQTALLSRNPLSDAIRSSVPQNSLSSGDATFQPLETPLLMSGFSPVAIRFWQQQTAGTALQPVAAGGALALSGSSASGDNGDPSPTAHVALEPGSAVSMQLIRGDLEVAATCTVTYIDRKQLLACGHPVLGAGPVSLPMTTANVVTTRPRPLTPSRSSTPASKSGPSPRIGSLQFAVFWAQKRI